MKWCHFRLSSQWPRLVKGQKTGTFRKICNAQRHVYLLWILNPVTRNCYRGIVRNVSDNSIHYYYHHLKMILPWIHYFNSFNNFSSTYDYCFEFYIFTFFIYHYYSLPFTLFFNGNCFYFSSIPLNFYKLDMFICFHVFHRRVNHFIPPYYDYNPHPLANP